MWVYTEVLAVEYSISDDWLTCKEECRLLPGCSHYTFDDRNYLCSKIKWAYSDAQKMELVVNNHVTFCHLRSFVLRSYSRSDFLNKVHPVQVNFE